MVWYIMWYLMHFVTKCYWVSRAGWNLLQDLIQSRTKKLSGAYEIHKFNRDAKEILGRVKVRMRLENTRNYNCLA